MSSATGILSTTISMNSLTLSNQQLAVGASPDNALNDGTTPLYHVAEKGDARLLQLLVMGVGSRTGILS